MSVPRAPAVMDLNKPVCLCGREMRLATVEPIINDAQAEIRIFDCAHCSHELRIMHSLQDDHKAA